MAEEEKPTAVGQVQCSECGRTVTTEQLETCICGDVVCTYCVDDGHCDDE